MESDFEINIDKDFSILLLNDFFKKILGRRKKEIHFRFTQLSIYNLHFF